jgi:hypothetical protein
MLSGGGVVLYDTTWGTNRYGMKLGCFTTVGRNGETIILAASLLMHETDDSFVWAFEQFRKAFRIPPSVFVTDGDPKMASAVSKIFPDSTKHMLCIYHLSLNFTEHIKPLFPDQADFKVATDLFQGDRRSQQRAFPTGLRQTLHLRRGGELHQRNEVQLSAQISSQPRRSS